MVTVKYIQGVLGSLHTTKMKTTAHVAVWHVEFSVSPKKFIKQLVRSTGCPCNR